MKTSICSYFKAHWWSFMIFSKAWLAKVALKLKINFQSLLGMILGSFNGLFSKSGSKRKFPKLTEENREAKRSIELKRNFRSLRWNLTTPKPTPKTQQFFFRTEKPTKNFISIPSQKWKFKLTAKSQLQPTRKSPFS